MNTSLKRWRETARRMSRALLTGIASMAFGLTLGHSQSNRVDFTWSPNPPEEAIILYKFYDVVGTNRVLVGTSPTNYFTVTNWNPLLPRTVTVTASNMLGESSAATPLIVPKAPSPPVNLAPVHLSIESAPSLDISYDLVDWRQKFKIWTNAGRQMVTFATYPYEPVMFVRQSPLPQSLHPLPAPR